MSELQVNSIKPATPGLGTVSIAAQVTGVPGTEPNHFVTLAQLGLGDSTTGGVSKIYVDLQDNAVTDYLKTYAQTADAAALQIAKLYTNSENTIITNNFSATISSINDAINTINAGWSRNWIYLKPIASSPPAIVNYYEEIVLDNANTHELEITDETIDATALTMGVARDNDLLWSIFGIRQNSGVSELQLSINLQGSSASNYAALLVGQDLTSIQMDYDPITNTSTDEDIQSSVLNLVKQTGSASYNIYATIPPGYWYRLITPSSNPQTILSWQECKVSTGVLAVSEEGEE